MRLPSALAALASLSLSAACGTSYNALTGGDGGRGDATDLQLDVLAWDRVDADAGDHTDWKRLELADDTRLRIRAWTFEPRGFRGAVAIFDERGQRLATLKLAEREQELTTDTLAAGAWFVQVSAEAGAADYGLELTLAAGGSSRRKPSLD